MVIGLEPLCRVAGCVVALVAGALRFWDKELERYQGHPYQGGQHELYVKIHCSRVDPYLSGITDPSKTGSELKSAGWFFGYVSYFPWRIWHLRFGECDFKVLQDFDTWCCQIVSVRYPTWKMPSTMWGSQVLPKESLRILIFDFPTRNIIRSYT